MPYGRATNPNTGPSPEGPMPGSIPGKLYMVTGSTVDAADAERLRSRWFPRRGDADVEADVGAGVWSTPPKLPVECASLEK